MHSLDTACTVVNLTERTLTETETSVLCKGGNFAVTPHVVPTEDINAHVEEAIRTLPIDDAEEIKSETYRILKKSKPPPSNLTACEKLAIRGLNTDKTIVILPADKENATVIIKTEEYNKKIQELLDPAICRKLNRDPTNKILRKTNQLIKLSQIPSKFQREICKTEAFPPRL